MNARQFEILANQAVKERPYYSPLFPPSPYYRFFRLLAANHQPKLSVELGVCGGGGSLHLALGWPRGQVVGIDKDWHQWPEAIQHLEETCPNFTKWSGDSVFDAKIINYRFGNPEVLFIDTIHTRERTIEEFEAWKPYLSHRAIVCFDDLHRKEMDGFWDWLPGNKVRLDYLHPGSSEGGFGVWWNGS